MDKVKTFINKSDVNISNSFQNNFTKIKSKINTISINNSSNDKESISSNSSVVQNNFTKVKSKFSNISLNSNRSENKENINSNSNALQNNFSKIKSKFNTISFNNNNDNSKDKDSLSSNSSIIQNNFTKMKSRISNISLSSNSSENKENKNGNSNALQNNFTKIKSKISNISLNSNSSQGKENTNNNLFQNNFTKIKSKISNSSLSSNNSQGKESLSNYSIQNNFTKIRSKISNISLSSNSSQDKENSNGSNHNTFQNNLSKIKLKINNISLNNTFNDKKNNDSQSRSIAPKPKFIREFSNSLFSSNKESNDNKSTDINNKKNFKASNINAKDVSRVSGFVANHPSIAKRGLQAAAYASGDKETAKRIGQTSTKDIADTASKVNKGANFIVENQDTINEINSKVDKLNGYNNNNSSISSSPNKFINSSAISNSISNGAGAMPMYSPPVSSVNSGNSGSGNSQTSSRISAPPPLPGRFNGDAGVPRNNSTSAALAQRSINKSQVNRSNTIGHTPTPNTTKFNKPPPPPTPSHQPDYAKMQETITNSNIISSPKTIGAPPPLPNRPSSTKLKRSDSDPNFALPVSSFSSGGGGGGGSNATSGPTPNRSSNRNSTSSGYGGNQTQSPTYLSPIQTQTIINDCINEINRIFNIPIPFDNVSRYHNVFNQVAENNLITDTTVKALWVQSGIPKSVLAKIWTYVNRKLEGLLYQTEFIVGMYLIDQYLNGYDIERYFNNKK